MARLMHWSIRSHSAYSPLRLLDLTGWLWSGSAVVPVPQVLELAISRDDFVSEVFFFLMMKAFLNKDSEGKVDLHWEPEY